MSSINVRRQVPLTSILIIQYMYVSCMPAPQQTNSRYLGETKSYPGWHPGKN